MSFGNVRRLLQEEKKLLGQAEAFSMDRVNHDQVRILRNEMANLMAKEECM